jgi:urease accessory protein
MMNSLTAILPSERADGTPLVHCPPVLKTADPLLSAPPESTWDARLSLRLERRGAFTRLVGNQHHGPLYVQKPFLPEGGGVPHIYILHPPGGLVSGDRLEIDVHAGPGASALFTTPGAARIYRARPGSQRNQLALTSLHVADGAGIEWLPAETIVFPGAATRIETQFHLASRNSRLIAWDMVSLGLPARGEGFERGSFCQRLRIDIAGRPAVIDGLVVDAGTRDVLRSPAGLSGHPVLGWCIAGPWSTPRQAGGLDPVVEALRSETHGVTAGITVLNDFLLLRLLADSVMTTRDHLQRAWSWIRPLLLDREAVAPRIWNT